jgi:hypothetical protein
MRQFKFEAGRWVDTWNDGAFVEDMASRLDASAVELIVMDGWCGCGQPGLVVRLMHAYLLTVVEQMATPVDLSPEGCRAFSQAEDDREARCGGMEARTLLAYRADELGLTEHGSSVVHAWLTGAGRALLARMDGAA